MRIIEGFAKVKPLLSRQAVQVAEEDIERERNVRQWVDDVRRRGDAALFEYLLKFDGVKLTSLEVTREQIDCAYREVDKELIAAMKLAAGRIAAYHGEQKKKLLQDNAKAKLGWVIRPLQRVGVYVPGSSTPLPSSLLMTVVPARVAGVKEVILVTPPQSNGQISPIKLAAARIAGVDRVFSVGGAQAIAALAYGTESIPAVDKVYGPGNIYVMLAKKMVYGAVGIDGLFGPSEVIIIADDTANPAYVAADLLAQAEHGSLAWAILITTSRKVADAVNLEIEKQLKDLPRREIIVEALEKLGFIAVVNSVDDAVKLGNLNAPEHLCLVVKNAASYIDKVRTAGCLFVGENAVEALVDYAAGPSHVLPTGGTARFGSPLNVLDFVKLITIIKTNAAEIKKLGKATSIIARAEGLEAHARAVEKRLEDLE
ncbi:MAG: histidinol dehydrogenase [Chloroflexi bacterium RBG_16_50_11]|nr:MAG: histidinol dehydrogenase [Chloroflexi bacterium RBG_16_50_11]